MKELRKFMEEVERLQEAEDLLRTVLVECGGYGFIIDKMSAETKKRVQSFMKFDDSE
jgi:hypothetical protein